MGNIRNGLVEMRRNSAAGFSECIAAAEGRIDGLWLIIAADLASAKDLHAGAIRHAVAPYEPLDIQSLRPSIVSAGVAPGKDRHCRAVVISAAPGALQSARRTMRVEQLTRRATHRYIFIVATIEPAPENPLRAF
ncbi:hypothetical protein [Bradyrhizobium sp. B120]|uniref:hypothetical protein n=1 Tax=Bradyrhizobium sp. B120 TaxID=3410088 RepID=UPI003B97ECEC